MVCTLVFELLETGDYLSRVFSILSSLLQILEMDSLSFWMVFERLLGDVMELVALEWLAIEAHVFVGDLLYVLTDRSASFNSGSGFELNVISVLKRTSGSYEVGTSCLSCLQCSLYMVLPPPQERRPANDQE